MSAPKAFPADRLGQLGLTKLEYVATAIVAAEVTAVGNITDVDVSDCINLALDVLRLCAEREAE